MPRAAARSRRPWRPAALRAVVATSTLDLGVDWGDVDLVINVGAPKGASRLIQRVGRANHRLDEASRALLVPSNRFEVLECRAAIEAAAAGAHDTQYIAHRRARRAGAARLGHGLRGAVRARRAVRARCARRCPMRRCTRRQFDRIVDFVSTGGYALRAYERYARLRPAGDGRLRLSHPRLAQQYRMNAGTIVEAPMIKIRLVGRRRGQGASRARARPLMGGRVLGELEEYFIEQLKVGDTLRVRRRGAAVRGRCRRPTRSSRAPPIPIPTIPSYEGGKFPLSTHLARARARA